MARYVGEERREFLRKRARCILYYRVHASAGAPPSAGDEESDAVTADSSERGASLISGRNIPVGAAVHMRWTLILAAGDSGFQPRDFEVDGEVRVNTPFEGGQYRLGVVFSNLKEADRGIIADFIAGRPGALS